MTGVSRLLALAAFLGLAPACGPVTYLSRVTFGAAGEVAHARVSNAERMAPYEYTAATEYLRRSRELAGYARFHDANNFGQRALDLGRKATEVAQSRERNDEEPIFAPDGSMYITKGGGIKRGRPTDPVQETDSERPPLLDTDSAKDKKGSPR